VGRAGNKKILSGTILRENGKDFKSIPKKT